MADQTRVDRVDDVGVHLRAGEDLVVDVLFDGRRIWSFWTVRDTRGRRLLPSGRRCSSGSSTGTTQLSVVEHVSGARGVRRGGAPRRPRTSGSPSSTPTGRPLGIDKSNRITTIFDTRDAEHTKPLLDSTEQVLAALHDAGVEAFPAYGTLLGAIREQDFIGHDNDVDLGYVSRHTPPARRDPRVLPAAAHPARAGLRRRPLQRRRRSRSTSSRPTAGVRGLDVFGGYFLDGKLYLMGEIGTPVRGGLDLPARHLHARRPHAAGAGPAREAARGDVRTRAGRCPTRPSTSTTPRTTYRRLNGWFRGGRVMRNEWDRRFSTLREKMPKVRAEPAGAARRRAGAGSRRTSSTSAAGRGADALWFARRGVPTLGLDYAWGAVQRRPPRRRRGGTPPASSAG